jgi:RHS repeat-associated protein
MQMLVLPWKFGLGAENRTKKTLYEQYHPYGTSAYRAQDGTLGVSAKRYRYNGKERDDETKLYYYGARYYAPWLGRWTAADPLWGADGPNLYEYVRGSPIVLSDPNGMQSCDTIVEHEPDGGFSMRSNCSPEEYEKWLDYGEHPAPEDAPPGYYQMPKEVDENLRSAGLGAPSPRSSILGSSKARISRKAPRLTTGI